MAEELLKFRGGTELWDFVGGDGDRGVLGDIASRFLSSFYDLESAEASKVYIFSVSERVLDGIHQALNDRGHRAAVDPCGLMNFVYYVYLFH